MECKARPAEVSGEVGSGGGGIRVLALGPLAPLALGPLAPLTTSPRAPTLPLPPAGVSGGLLEGDASPILDDYFLAF